MKIKKSGKNSIKVYSNDVNVYIGIGGEVKGEEDAFYIGDVANQPKVISTPGEYEYGTVEFIVTELKEKRDGVANLYKIIINNVNLLYLTGEIALLDKTTTDLLGQVDVVLFAGKDVEYVDQMLKKLAPGKLIVFDYTNEQLDTLGLSAEDTTTANLKAADFGEEEQSIELIGLK